MRRLLLVLVLAAVAAVACGGSGRSSAGIVALLTEELLDRAAVWEPGPAAADDRLLGLLGLEPDRLRARLVTGAPAVTVVDHPGAGDAIQVLQGRGYATEGLPEGWTLLVRPAELVEETIGVPAVGVGGDVVVVGSEEEVRSVVDRTVAAAADAPSTPIPIDLLEGASVALVGTAAAAGEDPPGRLSGSLPGYEAFVITGTRDLGGIIALVVPDAGQPDAVALAERLMGAELGPGGGSGLAVSSVLRPVSPIAEGDRVLVTVEWLVPPTATLREGLDRGLPVLLAG